MNNPFLIGEQIYLRAPESGDEKVYAVSENHPDPRETLFYALPTTSEQQAEKIRKAVNDANTVLFTICRLSDNEPIGTTSFVRIDWIGRMATFYIAIAHKENWSHGYGSEVTQLMVDYAFSTMNLNRIQLHVSTENTNAVHVYQKIGFVIEGTLRSAMFHHNRYSDFHVMGMLKKDWENKQELV